MIKTLAVRSSVSAEVYEARARFYSVEEGFNIKRMPLAPCAFVQERDKAFAEDTPTSEVLFDRSAMLGVPFAATLPLLLTVYARVNRGERLKISRGATGEIYVVLHGQGRSTKAGDSISWRDGDIFCLPGGEAPAEHEADTNAILYYVSDEPALRFLGAGVPKADEAPIKAVLYPRAVTEARLQDLQTRVLPFDAPGRALNLSSTGMEALKTCVPSMTLTFNLAAPGERQRPYRHNAAALVLVLRQGWCHSVIGSLRLDWSDHAVILTPATEVHTHENVDEGPWALDGGLHYYARTMGFSFA